jgi:hypothetical protein
MLAEMIEAKFQRRRLKLHGRPPIPRNLAQTFLISLLKEGPMPSQEIRASTKEAGLSWATVRRAAEDLHVIATRVGGFGADGHYQWALG